LASSQSWLPLLRLSIPIGWRLHLLREIFTQETQAPANTALYKRSTATVGVDVYDTHSIH